MRFHKNIVTNKQKKLKSNKVIFNKVLLSILRLLCDDCGGAQESDYVFKIDNKQKW